MPSETPSTGSNVLLFCPFACDPRPYIPKSQTGREDAEPLTPELRSLDLLFTRSARFLMQIFFAQSKLQPHIAHLEVLKYDALLSSP